MFPWAWNKNDLKNSIEPILDERIMSRALKKFNFSEFFPYQLDAISGIQYILDNPEEWVSDICISSPTGTGKTFCYAIPLTSFVKNQPSNYIHTIIFVPSKVLSEQVKNVFHKLNRKLSDKFVSFSGIKNIKEEFEESFFITSQKLCFPKCNIVITTPGRFLEHITMGNYFQHFQHARNLIFDEADKLLSSKQKYQISKIFKILNFPMATNNHVEVMKLHPKKTLQKILLSATIPAVSNPFEFLDLFQPVVIFNTYKKDVNIAYIIPEKLEERFYGCDEQQKPLLLLRIILKSFNKGKERILCFTNSVDSTKRLNFILNTHNRINCEVILSEGISEKQKNETLKKFQDGEYNVVCTTDTCSRGLDFTNVHLVINYDFPHTTKSYVHRVGRTARGTQEGNSISLVTEGDDNNFLKIQTKINRRDKVIKIHPISQDKLIMMEEWFEEAKMLLRKRYHG